MPQAWCCMTSVARKYAQSPRGRSSRSVSRSKSYLQPTLSDHGAPPVILMVSGGADSTGLLYLAVTSTLNIEDGRGKTKIARERLHVLHINHQLRGNAALEDETFVCGLASQYGLPVTVERLDVAGEARKAGDNVENVGRDLRYKCANALANKLSDEWGTPRSEARILTAHTADDCAETFMMNAIKGSGASGLSSIPARRNRIVRPLLDKTHDELCDILQKAGLSWREDATNQDTRYLRAYVRHELLPIAKEKNPRLAFTLSQTCDILSDEDAYLNGLAQEALRKLERKRDYGLLALDAARMQAMDVAVARRVVRAAVLSLEPEARLEAQHINAILTLVANQQGSCTICLGMSCRIEHGLLFIRSRQAAPDAFDGWLEIPALSAGSYKHGSLPLNETFELRGRLMRLSPHYDAESLARACAMRSGGNTVLLDAESIGLSAQGGQLWIDAPQAGDIFCPLGMHGQSKKLSDFLNEMHIAAPDKMRVAIVRTKPQGNVVWVSRFRADERARCTSSTKLLLELSVQAYRGINTKFVVGS